MLKREYKEFGKEMVVDTFDAVLRLLDAELKRGRELDFADSIRLVASMRARFLAELRGE